MQPDGWLLATESVRLSPATRALATRLAEYCATVGIDTFTTHTMRYLSHDVDSKQWRALKRAGVVRRVSSGIWQLAVPWHLQRRWNPTTITRLQEGHR